MKGTLIAGVVTAAVLAGAGPAAADVLPVGTWQFNEGTGTVAHDSSWRRDNGTLGPSVTWAAGRFGGAISVGNGPGGVDIPDEPALDAGSVSVSAWVNSAQSPGAFRYILAKGANGCLAASYGLYTGVDGGVQFYVAANAGASWSLSPDPGPSLWDGRWHNVIGTFDGSTVRLYVDGQQVGTGTPDSSPIAYGLSTSNDLEIGNYAGCAGLGFQGLIDQVRVFNRVLGPQEIHLGVSASQLLPPVIPFDLVL